MKMNIMSLSRITKTVALAALAGFLVAPQAMATITLGQDPKTPSPPGPGTADPANVGAWLQGLIDAYNSSNGTSLPSAGTEVLRMDKDGPASTTYPSYPTFPSDTTTIANLPTGDFNYLVLHWGGSGGGVFSAYYIGGDTGTLSFTSPTGNGLSGYMYYSPVPEPSTIIAGALLLLPFGASTLRFVRSKNRA